MLILFDFKCPHCGHKEEALVERHERVKRCLNCTNATHRVISPVRCQLEGHSGHFPDAADKWARRHEKEGGVSEETKHELANQ